MKRLLYIVALVALPIISEAQVQKQVEVTKAYAPTLNEAHKIAITPNMVDTVKMTPDIDYTISSRSYQTELMLENFKPATITYWNYTRRYPLYVKAAAGVPLASEVDAYISTVNKDRGYAMAYVNHWGDYRNRKLLTGEKTTKKTTEMSNRVGGRAGFFLGKKTLEVDLYADQQVRHRYPVMGDMIRFGKLQGKLRFGDDFVDMSRWNFNVEVGGGIFSHKSRAAIANEERFRQTNLEADFVMAKQLGYHLFKLNVGYDGFYGGKSLEGYDNHTILAGLHYGVSGQKLLFALGLDYYFNKIDGRIKKHNSFMPYARMGWKSSTEAFVPYVELSSGYKRSDLASLLYSNPYFVASMEGMPYFMQMPNQHYASLKVGIDGNLGKGLFSYSAMFEYRRQEDPLWVDYGGYYDIDYAMYYPSWNDPTLEYVIIDESRTMRVNVGFKLHPIHWFELEAMANVRVHENKDYIPDVKPKFNTSVDVRFMGRKIAAEVNLDYRSERRWLRHFDATADHEAYNGWVSTDGEFELGALIEWQINDRWGVYVEGRNLTGSQIHEWLHYYTSSPQGMVGVKMNF